MKRTMFAVLALALAVPALADDAPATAATPAVTAKVASKATTTKKKVTSVAKKTTSIKDTAVQMIDAQIAAAKIDKTKPGWRTALPKPTPATFDPSHTYWAHMTTNKGPITIKFLPAIAPMHVTNFIYLSRMGFYDGLKFHRVIPNFMAQGGDPLGTGGGGPGYEFGSEFSPKARHDAGGKLSMANAGEGTDGSQFFLTFVATPWLNDKHTLFGEVSDATMPTLKALEASGTQSGQTTEPLTIQKVTIEVK